MIGDAHAAGKILALGSVPAVQVHLVRHACAGRKEDWDGHDDERPLDPAGLEQARSLVGFFAAEPVSQLLASPTRRCVETLEPLSEARGLPVERTDALLPDADPEAVLGLLSQPERADGVACTHGETMTALLPLVAGLARAVQTDDEEQLFLKGSIWTLTFEEAGRPSIVSMRHAMPSAIRACATHPSRQRTDGLRSG